MKFHPRGMGLRIRESLRPAQESLRNRPILALEGLAAALVANLATAFASMFAARMGATDYHIGLLNSLPPLFGLIVLIPGALAADRMKNKRRMVEITILVLAVCYLAIGLTPYLGDLRVWGLVLMFSISSSPASLYNISWQAFFSDVVPPELRNSYYSLRTKAALFTGMIVVLLSGFLLSYLPRNDSDRIVLYQVFLVVAFLASFLQFELIRRVKGGDASSIQPASQLRLKKALGSLMKSRRFLSFTGLSILLWVGWHMSWPMFFITQVRYLGANEAWLSWISVSSLMLNLATTGFWSRYIDRRGIRPTLVIGALGLATNPILYAATTYIPSAYALPILLMLNSIAGLTFTAFQLSSFQYLLEVVGEEDKTLRIAIYSSFTLMSNVLSPLFGVWIYSTLGSDRRALTITMMISSAIRILSAGAFAVQWWRMRSQVDEGILRRT